LGSELLLRPFFIVNAGLLRLSIGKSARRSQVEFTAPGNIEYRHAIGDGDDQLNSR
jgi:hypothetical protein